MSEYPNFLTHPNKYTALINMILFLCMGIFVLITKNPQVCKTIQKPKQHMTRFVKNSYASCMGLNIDSSSQAQSNSQFQ